MVTFRPAEISGIFPADLGNTTGSEIFQYNITVKATVLYKKLFICSFRHLHIFDSRKKYIITRISLFNIILGAERERE